MTEPAASPTVAAAPATVAEDAVPGALLSAGGTQSARHRTSIGAVRLDPARPLTKELR